MIVEIQVYLKQQRARVVLDAERMHKRNINFDIAAELICGETWEPYNEPRLRKTQARGVVNAISENTHNPVN